MSEPSGMHLYAELFAAQKAIRDENRQTIPTYRNPATGNWVCAICDQGLSLHGTIGHGTILCPMPDTPKPQINHYGS